MLNNTRDPVEYIPQDHFSNKQISSSDLTQSMEPKFKKKLAKI